MISEFRKLSAAKHKASMSNGELLLYNMRHVQHHAAQLNMLLRERTNSAPNWLSKGGQKIKREGADKG